MQVLLFLHGYNTSHEDALTALAKLVTGLQFGVIPVAFDWASAGMLTKYCELVRPLDAIVTGDREKVEHGAARFGKALKDLLAVCEVSFYFKKLLHASICFQGGGKQNIVNCLI